MTVGGRIRLVRLAACGIFLLLPVGWAASQALAEEVPVPTVPVPTTVVPDPVPPPSVAEPRPDPAPRPRATPKPAPAPAPAPRASTRPRVFTPPAVTQRPAAQAARAARVARAKAEAKAKATAQARARARATAKAKAKEKPAATVVRADPPVSSLARPIVTIELVRSNDEPATSNALLSSVLAFLAGLLIPVALVTAAVLARRRRPRATRTRSSTFAHAPAAPPVVPPEPAQQLVAPAVVATEQRPPAAPLARPVSRQPVLPPAAAETEQRTPAPREDEQPATEREEALVPEPIEAAAAAEWAGWEFCEIDWWRGYIKSHFFAKATTPGDADYIVRESPVFRWRGNGIPDATPEIIAAHQQLLETLRAEGWEDDPGTPSTWYAQTFRRREDPDAVAR